MSPRVPSPGPPPSLTVLLLWALCAASPAAQAPDVRDLGPVATAHAPFRYLDNVEGSHVDLVFAPVRPMAVAPDGALYAVNTHGSRLQHFDAANQLVQTFEVPWGPVSVAYWDSPFVSSGPGDEELLVVCRGTHVLARLDRASGATLALLALPTEPSDLVIQTTLQHAFISCAGADRVVEVDLASNTIVQEYAVDSKHPVALALDGPDVLVAAQFSGNNTTVDRGDQIFNAGPGGVLDLEDPSVAFQGLRDRDVFRIDPVAGTISPVLRSVGTVLFSMEVNPATGELWIANTEAHNAGPANRGTDNLRGRFISNRLSMARLPATGVRRPFRILDLDDSDPVTPGVQIDPTRTVGQPTGLSFHPSGHGYVLGLQTDNLMHLDPSGAFVREWNVGSLPRASVVRGLDILVYCWGDNTVEVWDLLGPNLVTTLSLGYDPTPTDLQEGRRLFFTAANSQDNNMSCASCHVDGAWDFLAWDTSRLPYDDKGPLVTKTMIGIEGLLPYNWRGEVADLEDFNGGFAGLLGGSPLAAADFQKLRDYLFSLQQPANPNEDPRRLVNSRLPFAQGQVEPKGHDAVAGQRLFYEEPASLGRACAECHLMPAVTASESLLGEPGEEARRSHFKVSILSSAIWRKEQRPVKITLNDNGTPVPDARATVGVGYTATGVKDTLQHFLAQPALVLDAEQERDVGAFLMQLDNGLAPAVHRAGLVAPGSVGPADADWVAEYLLPQADARHCDVAVFGQVDLGSGPVAMRWAYDRASGLFQAEDGNVADRALTFFRDQAAAGTGRNVFLGLPVGMGARWAIDRDLDELRNADELTHGSDPLDPDSDDDSFPDGQEVRYGSDPMNAASTPTDPDDPQIQDLRVTYVTTRVAKIQFDTDELATVTVNYSAPAGSGSVVQGRLRRNHTVFLRDLVAGQTYSVDVIVADAAGNSHLEAVPGGITAAPLLNGTDTVIAAMQVNPLQNSGGTLQFEVEATIQQKNGVPEPSQSLLGEVYVNGVLVKAVVLGSASDVTGVSRLTVTRSGLANGDEVTLNVVSVVDLPTLSKVRWSLPETPTAFRRVTMIYTGP